MMMMFITLLATCQAIVFDFGGVMTKEVHREVMVQFIRDSFKFTPEEYQSVKIEKKKALETGMRDQDFWLSYAKQHQISLPANWEQTFNQVMQETIGVNPEMFLFVEELKKQGNPVALLSNVDERMARLLREFNLYEPFKPCLLSYELGVEKPDPKIYEVLLKELQLPPQSIVFIDDLPENVASAKTLGIDALQFTSQSQLEKDLKERGCFSYSHPSS